MFALICHIKFTGLLWNYPSLPRCPAFATGRHIDFSCCKCFILYGLTRFYALLSSFASDVSSQVDKRESGLVPRKWESNNVSCCSYIHTSQKCILLFRMEDLKIVFLPCFEAQETEQMALLLLSPFPNQTYEFSGFEY